MWCPCPPLHRVCGHRHACVQLSWLNCSFVLMPAVLTLSIYTGVGISYLSVILRGGAGKNGSTVAVICPISIIELVFLLISLSLLA